MRAIQFLMRHSALAVLGFFSLLSCSCQTLPPEVDKALTQMNNLRTDCVASVGMIKQSQNKDAIQKGKKVYNDATVTANDLCTELKGTIDGAAVPKAAIEKTGKELETAKAKLGGWAKDPASAGKGEAQSVEVVAVLEIVKVLGDAAKKLNDLQEKYDQEAKARIDAARWTPWDDLK